MGKGKGKHSHWVCPIKKGKVVYEISGVSLFTALDVLKKCGYKMPFRFKIVKLKY